MKSSQEILKQIQAISQFSEAEISLAVGRELPEPRQSQVENAMKLLELYYNMEQDFIQTGYPLEEMSPFLPLQDLLSSCSIREKYDFYREECYIQEQEDQEFRMGLWRQMVLADNEKYRKAASGEFADTFLRSDDRGGGQNELIFMSEDELITVRILRVENRWELLLSSTSSISIKQILIGDFAVPIQCSHGAVDVSCLQPEMVPVFAVNHKDEKILLKCISKRGR